MTEAREPDAPAEIRIGPFSVPYALVGVGIAVTASVVLMGTLGILGAILTDDPHTDCPLGGSESLGWVELHVGRMSSLGRTHTLDHTAVVLSDPKDPRSRVCTLPRGTRVDVRERDRGRGGTWLQVHGDGVKLPH